MAQFKYVGDETLLKLSIPFKRVKSRTIYKNIAKTNKIIVDDPIAIKSLACAVDIYGNKQFEML